MFEKTGRPNFYHANLIWKVNHIETAARAAGKVINTQKKLNIAKDFVEANDSNALKNIGETLGKIIVSAGSFYQKK